ncbi:MAG TPA: MFS transporter, partial [Verrucomicrobium sp.]|nr:MFS transporter [Verrucomicrobium sp.]
MARATDALHVHSSWWQGVTRDQWLVLIIASAGWVFDAFEGQLFNVTRMEMLPHFLGDQASPAMVKMWGERFLGIFLIGGTLGGWLFSSLADRWGRKPVMILTILFYSIFSGLMAFATDLWQIGVLRFLVAMGVAGEWAVGAALVAEVFPTESRARAAGIFHSSSVIGLWLAAVVGMLVGTEWRIAYLVGILPALLVLWVRSGIQEPAPWLNARRTRRERLGSFKELLLDPQSRPKALWGALLAMVGLATFWGVFIAGQDLARELLISLQFSESDAAYDAKFAYGFVQTLGAALGMLSFGPLSVRFGRRGAFAFMHVGALIITPLICWLPVQMGSYQLLLILLPVFGFFTLGMHSGYAVYFPELFPTHLRATGAGFCFNTGRVLAAPVLFWLSGLLKASFPLPMA